MNHSECVTALSSKPYEQLRQLQNAFRILAKPEHGLRERAIILREWVSFEWAIQAAQDRWFPWPTTAASPGARKIHGVCWRQQGMLDILGYHVGETNPTPRDTRRCILEYAFEYHLPPINDVDY